MERAGCEPDSFRRFRAPIRLLPQANLNVQFN